MKVSVVFLLLLMSFPGHLIAQNMKLKLTVNNKELTATLDDNEAVRELIKMVPMTVAMTELHGNEKYCKLPKRLPGKAINPDMIRKGDLMLWIGNVLVLFYDTFPTPYDYVRMGRIDNISELTDVLGSGNVKVKFELIKE